MANHFKLSKRGVITQVDTSGKLSMEWRGVLQWEWRCEARYEQGYKAEINQTHRSEGGGYISRGGESETMTK